MTQMRDLALALSGALIAASLLIATIGRSRLVLSPRAAAIISGLGVGLGTGAFVYLSLGGRDLLASAILGLVLGGAAALAWIAPVDEPKA